MGESIVARIFARMGIALAALVLSAQAAAALVTAPTYLTPSGQVAAAIGFVCINPDLSSCTFGGGGGGVTANASALPTGITAGMGKSLNLGLFSDLFVTVTDGAGGLVNWNAPIPPGTNTIGNTGVVVAQTGGAGGSPPLYVAASDNHQNLKAGAGIVRSISGYCSTSACVPVYVRLYDAPNGFNGCNSSLNMIWSGVMTFPGFKDSFGDPGRQFANGLSICATGAFGSTDTTNATANQAVINVTF